LEDEPKSTAQIADGKDLPPEKTASSMQSTTSGQPITEEECHVLTITQASNYEEFLVVKVNAWGNRQNRVIGIDQSKLYNYDQEVHSNSKEGITLR